MASSTKYHIIKTLENDAPPKNNVNWCTISFLTPQKMEKTKYLDVKGFKVHNGYNTEELAKMDVQKIKEKNKNHDVYISQIGKIYAWDDDTKTDEIYYDDQRLNDLEEKRRDNVNRLKLVKEQYSNEFKNFDTDRKRALNIRKKLQKKLYERGLISKQEYELMMEENKPSTDIKEISQSLEKIKDEIEKAYQTDYLDENEPTGLKYGCMTIYSPKYIGGLKTLLFKVRGLFQTPAQLTKHIKELQKLYPNDRIYQFEVGKWTAFSEKDGIESMDLLKQLNYSMKCYLEYLEVQKEEFEKRKEENVEKARQHGKLVQIQNRNQRRKEKREVEKKKAKMQTSTSENQTSLGDATDAAKIQDLANYLDDPELRNKYPTEGQTVQTLEI